MDDINAIVKIGHLFLFALNYVNYIEKESINLGIVADLTRSN
jgi:hypothetical protein